MTLDKLMGAADIKHWCHPVGTSSTEVLTAASEVLSTSAFEEWRFFHPYPVIGKIQSGLQRKKYNILEVKQFFMDTSLTGWGAVLDEIPVQGHWFRNKTCLPISVLELWMIFLALLHFHTQIEGQHVLIRTDNILPKAYLNKQGGCFKVISASQ